MMGTFVQHAHPSLLLSSRPQYTRTSIFALAVEYNSIKKKFSTNLSVPLLIEYEDAAKRIINEIALKVTEIDHILNYIYS